VGGLAIVAGTLPVAAFGAHLPTATGWTLGLPCLALVLVSLADDIRAVAVLPRLLVHACAAVGFAVGLALAPGAAVPLPWLALAALAVAWSLNLYNFMDGSDGLAALMTVTGFGAYGVVLLQAGLPASLPLGVVAATLPVLAVNRPPARLFLGDVGAVPLGFLAAALGVCGIVDGAWGWWFPPLVFLPFAADATVTLLRRALARERFWEAHKSHYYQRLLQMGAGHAGTLAVYGAVMLGTALSAAVCAIGAPASGPAALGAWCAIQAIVFAAIDYHWRRSPRPS
jgi:UDP-N-acetylmuramyl pentapeptide phosphotransferase/UDP-N-acetylglucosamine-1-phosphate transferase